MQYIYVLDYSTPSRHLIEADDRVDLSDSDVADKLLRSYRLKASECSWLITDHRLDEETHLGITRSLM